MKIFWLTPTQLIYGMIVGLAIAVVFIYATVPHPVEVPVQVITPVPTPPPVVITEQPQPVQQQELSSSLDDYNLNGLIQVMIMLLPLVIISSLILPLLTPSRRERY